MGTVLERIAQGVGSPCRESKLPAKYHGPPVPLASNLGRGLALSLPRRTVTVDTQGQRTVVVYRSYALDPSSELGDAGYRLQLRDAGGKVEDLSLGFSEMRPYVIVHNDKLPLLDGDDLQLAVDARELDDASVTFPPVGLRAKRQEKDLLLRCPLAELRKDTDGDGLTDIEEARLVTDPSSVDTDGDGLSDKDDPAPLGADAPSTPEQEVRQAAYRQLVSQRVKGELLIEQTNGPRLGLSGVDFRVLSLTAEELEAYQKRFGFRVTFKLGVKMQDATHAKVSVSFGWTGGEWNAEKEADGWKFSAGSLWIT